MEFQCFEVKPEDDSYNVTECLHEDMPSTGMFAGSGKQVLFLCTAFAIHVSIILGRIYIERLVIHASCVNITSW